LGQHGTVEEYLNIRADYEEVAAWTKQLLKRMARFEKTITDKQQRKSWHATRARIIKAKKTVNLAMSEVYPE
jgi:predicted transcriptional regulator